jgi:hypothetical protein
MKKSVKIAIAVIALLIVGTAIFLGNASMKDSEGCSKKATISKMPSPNNHYSEAQIIQEKCGVWEQATVRLVDMESQDFSDVFSIQGYENTDKIQVEWVDGNSLDINYSGNMGKLIKSLDKFRDIKIENSYNGAQADNS